MGGNVHCSYSCLSRVASRLLCKSRVGHAALATGGGILFFGFSLGAIRGWLNACMHVCVPDMKLAGCGFNGVGGNVTRIHTCCERGIERERGRGSKSVVAEARVGGLEVASSSSRSRSSSSNSSSSDYLLACIADGGLHYIHITSRRAGSTGAWTVMGDGWACRAWMHWAGLQWW